VVIVAQASYLARPVRGDIIHPMQMRTDRPIQRWKNPAMPTSQWESMAKPVPYWPRHDKELSSAGPCLKVADHLLTDLSTATLDNLDDHQDLANGSLDTLVI